MPAVDTSVQVWIILVDGQPVSYNQSFDHAFVAARRLGGKTKRTIFPSFEALHAWADEHLL